MEVEKQKNKRIKHETNLTRIFYACIIQIGISLCLIFVVMLIESWLLQRLGIIIAANTLETQVEDWIESGADIAVIPAGVDYAEFSTDGDLILTNMSGKILDKTEKLFFEYGVENNYVSMRYIYQKINAEGHILIIRYAVKATWASGTARKYLPDVEVLLVAIIIIRILASIILITVHKAKKIKRELVYIENATYEIGKKNLDFAIQRTRIKELNQIVDALDAMKNELQDSLQKEWTAQLEKRNQMSALAHDIKTPLTIIRGNAELLQEEELSSEECEYVDYILTSEAQIQNYIHRIIEISNSEQLDDNDCENAECNFPKLLGTISTEAKTLCAEKQITFKLDMSDLEVQYSKTSCPNVSQDKMYRIMMNLIDNAIQYSPVNGTIDLYIGIQNESVLTIRIIDDGRGFSREDIQHALDGLYRADKSRNDRAHYGLGLTIVKKIVEELNGDISLDNAEGRGACVCVNIPL